MKKLRAGLLGPGHIAQKHAESIHELSERVELVAVCGLDEQKTRAFASQNAAPGALIFTNLAEMFDRANLDLVIICLPPSAHSDEIELAARHGVHVLIEKPIALHSAQAWNMVRAAERAQIKTQVGFMFRFGSAVEYLKTQLQTGDFGPVGLMSANYFSNSLNAAWWRVREKSGGQIVEQAIHLFDLLRYCGGSIRRVYSRQANLFHRDVPGYDIEDVSATILEFTSGALGIVYATNAAIPNRWLKQIRVVAQNAFAEFSDWNHATFTPTDTPDAAPQTIASERNVFAAQLLDLLDAVESNGATRTPLREGALSLDVVLAAVRSGRSGMPEPLNEPLY